MARNPDRSRQPWLAMGLEAAVGFLLKRAMDAARMRRAEPMPPVG